MAEERSQDRLDILKKIEEYEKNGWFNNDVEADPSSKVLEPDTVDYALKKWTTRVKSRFANRIARFYFDRLIRKKQLITKEIIGLENFAAVEGGAIITCNHFNPFDNYAVQKAIDKVMKRRDLYKVIREGNYTAFSGIYGFFFRNCNTLPLSSNHIAMRQFLEGMSTLLARGEKILVYPEQAMWWNYKKPRPLKSVSFKFAVKNNVPIIPIFITMEDSEQIDPNGFPVQAYTIHIMPAIYPDAKLSVQENIEYLKDTNYKLWKDKYEEFYKIPLTYTCDAEEK